VVQRALENGWTVSDLSLPNYVLGGSNFADQQSLLDSYGTRNDLLPGYNEDALANLLRSGRGVILAVNAGASRNVDGVGHSDIMHAERFADGIRESRRWRDGDLAANDGVFETRRMG
jgi:hypothetical protein